MSDEVKADAPLIRVDNPFPLLDKMIERGTDPVALGQMMALAERWKAERAKEEFAVAMRACQAAMPVVVKDAENKHTRSRYARLEEVNKVIKPCYTEHGFSVSFGEGDCPIADMVRIIADVRHAGGHSAPYKLDMPMDGTGAKGGAIAMNPVQAKGSTVAYGRRYLICMIFNVTIADEDTDGNAENGGDPALTQSQIATLDSLLVDLAKLDPAFKEAGFQKFMLDLEEGQQPAAGQTWRHSTNSHYGPAMEMLSLKIAKAKKAGGQ